MLYKEEEWNICPENWKRNFKCMLRNSGLWKPDNIHGKWLFLIQKKNESISCPTNADQRNFLSALLEVDKRNDIYRKTRGRKLQAKEDLRKFRECLNLIEKNWEQGFQIRLF